MRVLAAAYKAGRAREKAEWGGSRRRVCVNGGAGPLRGRQRNSGIESMSHERARPVWELPCKAGLQQGR